MSRDVEQLRGEIEHTRERMSETLDQLGERLNPNRIKEQVRENIREATVGRMENMARNAVDRVQDTREGILNTIRDNPIPAAMIGIGLGWMLFNGRRNASATHAHAVRGDDLQGGVFIGDVSATTPRLQQDDAAGGMGASISHNSGSGVIDRVRDRISTVGDNAGSVIGDARTRLSDVAVSGRERIGDMAQRVSHRASDVANSTRYQAARVEDRLHRTFEDNPLALGAVALAVGVAAGLAIPSTEREAELMGDHRDRLLERAREAVGAAKERAQDAAERLVEDVSPSATASTNANEDTRSTTIL